MKPTCKLFGHKVDPRYNDCGYPICQRCQMHGYYDGEVFYKDGILKRPFYYLRRLAGELKRKKSKEELPF